MCCSLTPNGELILQLLRNGNVMRLFVGISGRMIKQP